MKIQHRHIQSENHYTELVRIEKMERNYQTHWKGNWVFTLPFIILLLYLFL